MNVLVTSLGSNTAIGVLKAFNLQNDKKIFTVGTDSNSKELCAGSAFVDKFITLPNVKTNPDDYEQQLLDIIQKHNIQCVIPIHDAEVAHIACIAQKHTNVSFWAVNTPDVVSMCNNKRQINMWAETLGISVPTMYNDDNLGVIRFPIIIKPNTGVSSQNISLANNEDEYFFMKQRAHGDYIQQQYITGIEYTVDCYSSYYNKMFYGGVVRQRIETKSGIATKSKIVHHPTILELCEKILNALQYQGASNLQFIVSKNDIFFIEINPRFSGAGILSYKAHFNSPLFTIIEASNETLPDFNSVKINNNLIMTRYWNEVFYE